MPALPRAAFVGRCLALALVLVFLVAARAAAQSLPALLVAARAAAQSLPALPEVYLDTTYAPPTGGNLIVVGANGNLQLALDQALPGDILQLQAGASFTGNFTLPNKPGAGWIYIQSSAYSSLPAPGTRVNPTHAGLMPRIVSPNTAPAITSELGAHHYRFVGIEITTAWASTSLTHTNVIKLGYDLFGNATTSVAQLPTDIIFDRCYIHGTPTGNVRRGIFMNGIRTAVIDSYLADFHEVGADSQAVLVTNSPGPFKIVNNHLEGAGENVMFGGADPSIIDLVPSDAEIVGNHVTKPLAWRGSAWTIKNLLELKNARRLLIQGNVFENNWAAAQDGAAIVLKSVNQDGGAPWSVTEDVTFVRNIVRHSASGIRISGRGDGFSAGQTARILIRDNLLQDIDGSRWGGYGCPFSLYNDIFALIVDHNTADGAGIFLIIADGLPPEVGFVFRNNIGPRNDYGIKGGGTGEGLPTLQAYFPLYVVEGNAIVGGSASYYPPGNFFPSTMDAVGFVDLAAGDYRLAPSSPYKNSASDGTDIGADIDAVNAATAGVSTAASTPDTPPPSDGTQPSVLPEVFLDTTYAPPTSGNLIVVGADADLPTLTQSFPNAVFDYNVLAGQPDYGTRYPTRNFFPTTLADVDFNDLATGDCRLAPSSPYKNSASDGTDISADIDAVNAATAGVLTGASALIR